MYQHIFKLVNIFTKEIDFIFWFATPGNTANLWHSKCQDKLQLEVGVERIGVPSAESGNFATFANSSC